MNQKETFPEAIAVWYDTMMNYFDYSKTAAIIDNIIRNNFSGTKLPILEVGIGTGNLALELMALEYDVEGIDHSPAMLKRAIQKGIIRQALHLCDIKDFSLRKKFGAIISHAGPLRIDYTPTRGYFFETYLNPEEIDHALENTANHLVPQGLLIMSIQNAPERGISTKSSPTSQQFQNGYEAVKIIEEMGSKRRKRRILKQNGKVITHIDHEFVTMPLTLFDERALHYQLISKNHDPTNHFYIYRRKE